MLQEAVGRNKEEERESTRKTKHLKLKILKLPGVFFFAAAIHHLYLFIIFTLGRLDF